MQNKSLRRLFVQSIIIKEWKDPRKQLGILVAEKRFLRGTKFTPVK